MAEKFNKEFMKESILQACEDIKSNVNSILDNIDELSYLNITIDIHDGEIPSIRINSDYTKWITVTDKLCEAAING